jgi:hypothetical protein
MACSIVSESFFIILISSSVIFENRLSTSSSLSHTAVASAIQKFFLVQLYHIVGTHSNRQSIILTFPGLEYSTGYIAEQIPIGVEVATVSKTRLSKG